MTIGREIQMATLIINEGLPRIADNIVTRGPGPGIPSFTIGTGTNHGSVDGT
jgi:hypothetical protein